MTDLDDAVAAFRETQDRDRGDAEAGRRRLLRAVVRRDRRRKLGVAAALALALVATNSTTWAWSTGRLEGVAAWLGASAAEPTRGEASRGAPATRGPAPQPAPPEAHPRIERPTTPPAPAVAPPPAPRARAETLDRPRGASRTARSPTRRTPSVAAASAASEPLPESRAAAADDPRADTEPSGDDALAAALRALDAPSGSTADPDRRAFASAHRLHHGGATPLAALRAWDRYLALYPQGRFVPEARFNRAVTLLRLHRDDAARAALRPFAEGAFEGLRQREARALLEALDRGTLRR
ncbi:MAG: hypothetical protein VYE22_17880 [Myxococcota bacterium]|nr:hypothetical protein [Myxococcota bacterium]